jgi:hypothetical protein
MKSTQRLCTTILAIGIASASFGQTLIANTTSDNGGLTGWGMFFNLAATGTDLTATSLTTASTSAASGSFTVEVFVRAGSGLGGPLASGPGSSTAGWTSLGTAAATQGAVGNGISLPIDIPDIAVANGSTVGVAMVFTGAGPRYFGTGAPALQTFSDGTLTLTTGDSRSVPFTTTGSFFSSRGLTGSITYAATPVPEPASMAILLMGGAALIARRRLRS